jgi:hypothetical protein
MRKTSTSIALVSLAIFALPQATPAFGQTAPATPAPSAEKKPAPYSVESTQIGKLIDDPAAAAILKKLIPGVWANEMFQTMGREQTLKGIQQYEADLTDAKLGEIQAELNKIPAKG